MRARVGIVVLSLVVLAAGCATSGGVAVPQADVDAVNAVIESQRATFNARNLDGFMLAIADDAKVVSLPAFGSGQGVPESRVTKVQYREEMTALMARGDRALLEHANWTVSFSDPTHATADGQVDLGGQKADFQYKLEKRDGRWLIVESTARRK